jgi:hypothetical protein
MQHLKVMKISTRNIKLPETVVWELLVTHLQLSRINLYMMEYGRLDGLIIVMQGEG